MVNASEGSDIPILFHPHLIARVVGAVDLLNSHELSGMSIDAFIDLAKAPLPESTDLDDSHLWLSVVSRAASGKGKPVVAVDGLLEPRVPGQRASPSIHDPLSGVTVPYQLEFDQVSRNATKTDPGVEHACYKNFARESGSKGDTPFALAKHLACLAVRFIMEHDSLGDSIDLKRALNLRDLMVFNHDVAISSDGCNDHLISCF